MIRIFALYRLRGLQCSCSLLPSAKAWQTCAKVLLQPFPGVCPCLSRNPILDATSRVCPVGCGDIPCNPLSCCCYSDAYLPAQIRCGDLYAGKVVEEFNSCAITKHNCVAARVDVNKYPEPPPESLVKSFDINDFTVCPNRKA